MTLVRWLSSVDINRARRRIGEPFVYLGNVIAGRNKDMVPAIDLIFKDEKNEEFLYRVVLTMRRYDIEVGIFETYEEAGKVSDNIERSLEEMK